MNKLWAHLSTVFRHKAAVFRHCVKCGIIYRGIVHDMSKFSLEEFIPGVKFYQGTRSPNEAERAAFGFSRAWMHHKGRNKHHFEYWTDYDPATKSLKPVKMPVVFVVEMFCDRVAASKTYLKDKYTDSSPLEYYQKGRASKVMHSETAALLEDLLTTLASQGEAAAFQKARQALEKSRMR